MAPDSENGEESGVRRMKLAKKVVSGDRKKEKLKALSEERAERWPNTIKALRAKRLLARKEQLERLEEERCKLEKVDAAIRENKRRQQIEKANNILQLPHLTTLRSKMIVASVLKERNAQLLYKVGMQENCNRQEQKWLDFQKQQQMNWKEEEEKEKQDKRELLITLSEARDKQLQESQSQFAKEKEKKHLENEKLRQLAKQDQADTQLKEQLKKKKAHETLIDIKKEKKAHQAHREQEKEKLISIDRKIAEYAAKRERTVQEKNQELDAKAAWKNAQHEAFITRQEQVLLAAQVDSETGLNAQVKEREIAENAREKMRKEKSCKNWEACNYSRKQQIHLRRKELEEEKEEEKDEAFKSWQRCWKVKAEDEAEEKSIAAKDRHFADHHLKSVGKKEEEQMLESEESKKEYLQAFQRIKEEDVTLEALTL